MTDDDGRTVDQYRAFFSYSHRDDDAARALHRRLEAYRVPRNLVNGAGALGPIPPRLTPIFRDLDELSAANDLTAEIKSALARSCALVVLASPGAKASLWVNKEIQTFRALHGETRPILVALIEGEPEDAFPSALTEGGHEPVAADFRKGRDGRQLALLKLVAGLAGAPLDALVQRDAQRKLRTVMTITLIALAAVVAMALLLAVAQRAQKEAQRQREQAEGLVEYMLTDLRDRLKGVGRIDVMTAVNERAMSYYARQGRLDDLAPESLERRARILHAMGEDDDRRGDLKLALGKFAEAHRVTGAILPRSPANADRLFAHGQSEYWLGYIAYRQEKLDVARARFSQNLRLSKQALALDPRNMKFEAEVGHAETNLCALEMTRAVPDLSTAQQDCSAATKSKRALVSKYPQNTELLTALANSLAWDADVQTKRGNHDGALALLREQLDVASRLLAIDPRNVDFRDTRAVSSTALAEELARRGVKGEARQLVRESLIELKALQAIDPRDESRTPLIMRLKNLEARLKG